MPVSSQLPYKKYSKEIYTNSIQASKKVLSIPMHPYLNKRIQDKIIKIIKLANEN